jgi:hypothetical protein
MSRAAGLVAFALMAAFAAHASAQCPPGLAATPRGCVPGAPAVAPPMAAPPMQVASAGSMRGWPVAPRGVPDGLVNPRATRGFDQGLIIAGAIVGGIGYLTQFFLALGFDGQCWNARLSRPGACNAWPISMIPLVGGLLQGLGFNSSAYSLAAGIPTSVAQFVGLAFVLHALVFQTNDLAGSQPMITVVPTASNADYGLTIGGRFH